MMTLPTVDIPHLLDVLARLLNTPSPSGYAREALQVVEAELKAIDPAIVCRWTRKGALLATLPGMVHKTPRALTAHVDTLGAMVKEIKSNGRLRLTKVGGFAWNSVEGEGVTVLTAGGGCVRGSLLLDTASTHVYGKKVNETLRDDENMEVRLDARTTNAEETTLLGVAVGDYVVFDPRLEINAGYIRSRHLDDKTGAACILAAVRALREAGLSPADDVHLFFSNYEEVGHGAAGGIPDGITELVVVDMAAVGEGQMSDEFHVTLCFKDSGGPYDHELSQRLRRLADEQDVHYVTDIYPYYGSDGGAYWRAGGDVAVALIGPGVDASHNYERTHTEALVETTKWITAYLLSKT